MLSSRFDIPSRSEDDTGSLEKARERLYEPDLDLRTRTPLTASGDHTVPHTWEKGPSLKLVVAEHQSKRHVRLATLFFIAAFLFFLVSLAVAGYLLYFGGNAVSVDKIAIDIQGPTTIAGGDTVPFSLTITNKNSVAVQNATIEIDFPTGTRDAANVLTAYPRYVEKLGTLESGATVTRSIKAVVFGGAGQALSLPVSFSYGTAGSNAVFAKKSSYTLAISTTPLSVSVDTLAETVSGQPLSLSLTVRSNATVPLNNIVLANTLPFGFSTISSSLPLNNSSFLLGTLAPGASKTITLVGTLIGQNNEQRVFHFTVGTAKSSNDQTLAVTYMTQDATVNIAAPFINTTLALNGDTGTNVVVTSGTTQSVTVSYVNTLATNVTNATVVVGISGSAVDYNSIQSSNGFYNSVDHTVVFSRDTDSALAMLAPGASGLGTFSFSTLPASTLTAAPTITFTTSVSGTRIGQSKVPEQVTASATKTAKVATEIVFSASSLHTSGPFAASGPIPPRADQTTTYSIMLDVHGGRNTVTGGVASTILPSYVTYNGLSTGVGSFSYDTSSHTMTWNVGDLTQGASAQGTFQVSLTPSTSQKGSAPTLTSPVSFSGYDRFAGVSVSATADPVTTETKGDPGYSSAASIVQ